MSNGQAPSLGGDLPIRAGVKFDPAPPEALDLGVGDGALDGTKLPSDPGTAEAPAADLEMELRIAYLAAEEEVVSIVNGKEYHLPLPTPYAFPAFKSTFEALTQAADAGDSAATLEAVGRLLWILQNEKADDFNLNAIPEDAGRGLVKGLSWAELGIWRALLVEAAMRLREASNFYPKRTPGVRPTTPEESGAPE